MYLYLVYNSTTTVVLQYYQYCTSYRYTVICSELAQYYHNVRQYTSAVSVHIIHCTRLRRSGFAVRIHFSVVNST